MYLPRRKRRRIHLKPKVGGAAYLEPSAFLPKAVALHHNSTALVAANDERGRGEGEEAGKRSSRGDSQHAVVEEARGRRSEYAVTAAAAQPFVCPRIHEDFHGKRRHTYGHDVLCYG